MKTLGKRLITAGTILSLLAGAAGTYAYFSDVVTVKNRISLGDVNIGLKEYELRDGKEIPYENGKVVLPGDSISKIPRITNYGEPCWIRARLTFGNSGEGLEGLSDELLSGFSPDWVKLGEYYYYTKVVGRLETVTLFRSVKIPAGWTEEHAGQKLTVEVRADAIQSANFSPDFQDMSPWGNQEIQLCVHETNGEEIRREKNVELTVEFQGDAHKLVAVPDDFFANFDVAMPGDVLQDQVEISNTTAKTSEIFFHTGLICQREDRMDLLKKLGLSVRMDGRELYSGNLMALELAEEVSLGLFRSGQKGILDFTVTVPPELDNAYALRDTMVKWYFSVYETDTDPVPAPEITDTPQADPEQEETSEVYYRRGEKAVWTGDETSIVKWLLILAASAALSAVIWIYWKRGKRA